MKAIVITFFLLLALGILGAGIVKHINLNQDCIGYLKRAADANTVETANEELSKAISYLESNNLTTGYTSVLWRTPDEDIGFWYKNLKESHRELSKVDSTTTALERTNLLMKLRETLIDNGESGDHITYPDGLSVYPNNFAWAIAAIVALGIIIVCIAAIAIEID